MKSALIGYTGFVGSNLLGQHRFDDLYNSSNIESIQGKDYDLIVCAGTKSEVWKANLDPNADWTGIEKLLNSLKKVSSKKFILISSILVYPVPDKVDEDTPIDIDSHQAPYGKHRFQMEQVLTKQFPEHLLVRLPQLIGSGLKKNFIYDLIHNNALHFTHKDTVLQIYNLTHLWADIKIAQSNNLSIINFATEPLSAKQIAKESIDLDFETITQKPPLIFNFQSKYGSLYGSTDKYLYHHPQIISEINEFVKKERNK